jgi:hypothetical protein
MDFFKKLGERVGSMGDDAEKAARERYGAAYDEASPMEKAAMRSQAGGAFSFKSGSPGSEQDLESFVNVRPITPSMANPMQAYSSLYNMYGGRKMRGLLFD